jgi:hypothetical protein
LLARRRALLARPQFASQKEVLMFLIDAGELMLGKAENAPMSAELTQQHAGPGGREVSYLDVALCAVRETLRNRRASFCFVPHKRHNSSQPERGRDACGRIFMSEKDRVGLIFYNSVRSARRAPRQGAPPFLP